MDEHKKPPMGIKPKYVWDKERIQMILQGIVRYSHAGKRVPLEWVAELAELSEVDVDLKDGERDIVEIDGVPYREYFGLTGGDSNE